ncbi:MAG TPA: porin, partial [Opitutaceae bacterium]
MTPRLLSGFLALSVSVFGAEASERAELQALRAQVQQLEQQVRMLSQQIEAKSRALGEDGAPEPQRPSTLADAASRSDVPVAAASSTVVRVRGLVQVDARRFVGDDTGLVSDTFTIRRARLIAEGTAGRRYGYLFGAEFGGSTVNLRDASFSVWLSEEARLSAGKMKTPLGLEMLQSAAASTFLERSLVTRFLPIRDIGVQLDGAFFQGRMNYAVGVFNGVADGGSSATNADFDQDTDLVGRVMFSPWSGEAASPLRGLSFG